MQTQMFLMGIRMRIERARSIREFILRPDILRSGMVFWYIDSEILECTSNEFWLYASGACILNGKIERKISCPTVGSVR